MRNLLNLLISIILFFVFLQILGPIIAIILVVMLIVWLVNVWKNAGNQNINTPNNTYTQNNQNVIDVEYTERRIHDDSERD